MVAIISLIVTSLAVVALSTVSIMALLTIKEVHKDRDKV